MQDNIFPLAIFFIITVFISAIIILGKLETNSFELIKQNASNLVNSKYLTFINNFFFNGN